MALAEENIAEAKALLREARDLLYDTAYRNLDDTSWVEYPDDYKDGVKSAFFDLAHIIEKL